MDTYPFLPLVVALIAIAAFYIVNTARFFTLREHQDFKNSIHRELDQIRHNINLLEATRPTTGELKAVIEGHLVNGIK